MAPATLKPGRALHGRSRHAPNSVASGVNPCSVLECLTLGSQAGFVQRSRSVLQRLSDQVMEPLADVQRILLGDVSESQQQSPPTQMRRRTA